MMRSEAQKTAATMRRQGRPYSEIVTALRDSGYVGSKSGKPLTVGGVHALIKQGPRKSASISQSRVVAKRRASKRGSDRSMLDIIFRLLSNDKMDAADRIAASTMLIESHVK